MGGHRPRRSVPGGRSGQADLDPDKGSLGTQRRPWPAVRGAAGRRLNTVVGHRSDSPHHLPACSLNSFCGFPAEASQSAVSFHKSNCCGGHPWCLYSAAGWLACSGPAPAAPWRPSYQARTPAPSSALSRVSSLRSASPCSPPSSSSGSDTSSVTPACCR